MVSLPLLILIPFMFLSTSPCLGLHVIHSHFSELCFGLPPVPLCHSHSVRPPREFVPHALLSPCLLSSLVCKGYLIVYLNFLPIENLSNTQNLMNEEDHSTFMISSSSISDLDLNVLVFTVDSI